MIFDAFAILIRTVFLATAITIPVLAYAQDTAPKEAKETNGAIGYATYSELTAPLFITALYGDEKIVDTTLDSSDIYPKRLEFKFLSNVSNRKFFSLLQQYIAINNNHDAIHQNIKGFTQFAGLFEGTLKKGDHLVLTQYKRELHVSLNGVKLSQSITPITFDLVLKSWIGDVPPSREFKDSLTGETDSSEIKKLFESLSFSQTRSSLIRSWLTQPEIKTQARTRVPIKTTLKTATKEVQNRQPKSNSNELDTSDHALDTQPPKHEKTVNLTEEEHIEKLVQARLKEIENQRRQAALDNQAKMYFATQLLKHARKNIDYPKRSQKLKHTGEVVALVTIDRNGDIIEVEIQQEAKYSSLNNAVKKGIKQSLPFPQIPTEIDGDSFSFTVPVAFALSS